MKKIYLLMVTVMVLLSGCDINTTEVVKPGVDIFTDYIEYFERL